MSDLRKAAEAALAAMDYMLNNGEWYQAQDRADALRAALAQPEQEPVAWMNEHGHIDRGLDAILDPTGWTPLYSAPPQRKPLTDEEIQDLAKSMDESVKWPLCRAIEKAHGIGGEE